MKKKTRPLYWLFFLMPFFFLACSSNQSDVGGNCISTINCKNGLVCVDKVCVDNDFLITEVFPSSAMPGEVVKVNGKGFDFTKDDVSFLINDESYPILSGGIGWVKIYVPPVKKGNYKVAVSKKDFGISNTLKLEVKTMPQYGKYPGEIADKVKETVSLLMKNINMTFEAMIKEGGIPKEVSEKFSKEINTFILFSNGILKYKNELTDDEKILLDGMLYNSGIYGMLSDPQNVLLKSTVNACLNSPLSCFYILCDQTSFFASLISGLSSRLALVSAAVGAMPVVAVLADISLYVGLSTHLINVLIPSDLHELNVKNESDEKVTSFELMEGDEELFEIQGLFKTQETISEATYDVVLAGLMDELFPNSKKVVKELIASELIPIINDVFSKYGINPTDKIVSDIFDPVDKSIPWQKVYEKVDLRLFSETSTEALLKEYLGTSGVSVAVAVDFLNDNGVDFEEYDSAKTDNSNTASIIFKNDKSYIAAKSKGKTSIMLMGIRFDDKDLPWEFNLFIGSDWYKFVEKSIQIEVLDDIADDLDEYPDEYKDDNELGDSDMITDLVKIGCSDGTREGFKDINKFPNIASCSGEWSKQSLRNAKTGQKCGNSLDIKCVSPSNLCAETWEICMKEGNPSDLSNKISSEECRSHGGAGKFVAATSITSQECKYSVPYPCREHSGENGAEPVCCGTLCCFFQSNYVCGIVWSDTPYADDTGLFDVPACASMDNSYGVIGVMCCKETN